LGVVEEAIASGKEEESKIGGRMTGSTSREMWRHVLLFAVI
jgi:hypothetical protein